MATNIGNPIPSPENFDIQKKAPIDERMQFDTIADRDALPNPVRHVGLECYILATDEKYILFGGETNSDWRKLELFGGSSGSDTLDGLSDVNITNGIGGDVLVLDHATQKWVNIPQAAYRFSNEIVKVGRGADNIMMGSTASGRDKLSVDGSVSLKGITSIGHFTVPSYKAVLNVRDSVLENIEDRIVLRNKTDYITLAIDGNGTIKAVNNSGTEIKVIEQVDAVGVTVRANKFAAVDNDNVSIALDNDNSRITYGSDVASIVYDNLRTLVTYKEVSRSSTIGIASTVLYDGAGSTKTGTFAFESKSYQAQDVLSSGTEHYIGMLLGGTAGTMPNFTALLVDNGDLAVDDGRLILGTRLKDTSTGVLYIEGKNTTDDLMHVVTSEGDTAFRIKADGTIEGASISFEDVQFENMVVAELTADIANYNTRTYDLTSDLTTEADGYTELLEYKRTVPNVDEVISVAYTATLEDTSSSSGMLRMNLGSDMAIVDLYNIAETNVGLVSFLAVTSDPFTIKVYAKLPTISSKISYNISYPSLGNTVTPKSGPIIEEGDVVAGLVKLSRVVSGDGGSSYWQPISTTGISTGGLDVILGSESLDTVDPTAPLQVTGKSIFKGDVIYKSNVYSSIARATDALQYELASYGGEKFIRIDNAGRIIFKEGIVTSYDINFNGSVGTGAMHSTYIEANTAEINDLIKVYADAADGEVLTWSASLGKYVPQEVPTQDLSGLVWEEDVDGNIVLKDTSKRVLIGDSIGTLDKLAVNGNLGVLGSARIMDADGNVAGISAIQDGVSIVDKNTNPVITITLAELTYAGNATISSATITDIESTNIVSTNVEADSVVASELTADKVTKIGNTTPTDGDVVAWDEVAQEYLPKPLATDNDTDTTLGQDITTTVAVGGIDANIDIPKERTVQEILIDMLTPYVPGAISDLNLSSAVAAEVYEVGTISSLYQMSWGSSPDSNGDIPTDIIITGLGFGAASYPSSPAEADPGSIISSNIPATMTWIASANSVESISTTRMWKWGIKFGTSQTVPTSQAEAQAVYDEANQIILTNNTEADFICTSDNNISTNYTYIFVPQELGDISNIILDDAAVITGALPVLGVWSITNSKGVTHNVQVYKSNAPGAFVTGNKLTTL